MNRIGSGCIEVSKERFFSVVGGLDVMPRVIEATLREKWHISEWELQKTREVIGKTASATCEPTRFFLIGSAKS